jgi:hypothetical protein
MEVGYAVECLRDGVDEPLLESTGSSLRVDKTNEIRVTRYGGGGL